MISSLPRSVQFHNDNLYILDQTLLPLKTEICMLETAEQVFDAIKMLRVRGAPAIGIAAAYGLLISLKPFRSLSSEEFIGKAVAIAEYLNSSRPTAVNLNWALKRMIKLALSLKSAKSEDIYFRLKYEADAIYKEDADSCRKIGEYGSELIEDGFGILTHCNAGALAVSELGTALAPIYTAFSRGKKFKVYADETRPLLQGARLTSWELYVSNIDVTLLCDNMAAYAMSKGLINMVIVGCDRVAANGDAANKIGTMGVALLAHHFNIPFYIACPSSTYDTETLDGESIIIEERDADEVINFSGVQTAPKEIKVLNPAFDVTPNEYITSFITDKGIINPPYSQNLRKLLELV